MNEKVRSRVQAADMGFLRRISGLTLLDKVKSANIRESQHWIAASTTGKIAIALVWTCDMNVPCKNSQKTALFNTDLVKGLEAVPELNGEIT